jgi:hypothetical protein
MTFPLHETASRHRGRSIDKGSMEMVRLVAMADGLSTPSSVLIV